jgi:rSAM/selenodomain-associated transferase 2
MEQSPLISVIIPAVNEAAALPATIARLRTQSVTHEIILSIGPSYDGTASIAKDHGAIVVQCDYRHRARQMNAGAAVARGNIFLFLHADTLVPSGAFENIVYALSDAGIKGGAFTRRYDARSRFLRFTCFLADWRGKNFGIFLGDQAIFVRRKIFEVLDGFKEIDIFEDFDLSRRLRRAGKTAMLRPPVLSAARRFDQRGPLMTTCRDLAITCQYLCGVPPQDLALKLHVRGTRLKRTRAKERLSLRPRSRSTA